MRIDLYEDHNYKNGKIQQEELEANFFACALLVPENKLRQILSITRDFSVIAKYFGVSESVIRMRICFMRME